MLGHWQGPTFYPLACRLTYSLLILHYVIPPVLLGEVGGQHIKASPKLREHHVIRVPWRNIELDIITICNPFIPVNMDSLVLYTYLYLP